MLHFEAQSLTKGNIAHRVTAHKNTLIPFHEIRTMSKKIHQFVKDILQTRPQSHRARPWLEKLGGSNGLYLQVMDSGVLIWERTDH